MKTVQIAMSALVVFAMIIISGCTEGEQAAAPEAAAPGISVPSTMIDAVNYDADSSVLTLNFGGDAYTYNNVPQNVYDGLMAAESKGKYFHANIKDKFEFTRK